MMEESGAPVTAPPIVAFVVDERYTPLKTIGTGSYGVVCSATDQVTGQNVAIKKIQRVFEIVAISKRTLVEVKLLKHFHSHDNIISLISMLSPPPPPAVFQDVYLVMELLESDLHKYVGECLRVFVYR